MDLLSLGETGNNTLLMVICLLKVFQINDTGKMLIT